jgi:antitoxin VapB
MSINIKNHEAETLLGEIKAATGKGTTELLLELLRAEAGRQRKLRDVEERRRKIEEICRRYQAKLPERLETPEEIIGYDEDGLPT